MKENKYDDQSFFDQYSQMQRSVEGLQGAGEWYVLKNMLPDLANKKVLDLGCGFGWHCRYAREQGAAAVVGVDLSAKMLERAKDMTNDPAISYLESAIEDINFPSSSFDVAISSLALHYVESFAAVCEKVHRCLVSQGAFILSVEHPVFTALPAQDWYYDEDGKRTHWPVDLYQQEGIRRTHFLGSDVTKYHRTLETYLNTLLRTGFVLKEIAEPKPSQEMLANIPEMKDELRRPIFLIISAEKK